ncbi:MAG TPA: DUF2723 domain-containing protein [Gemmatimonadaceae bacterium]|nr:DUF2723 domain-containing protein [Gemmatimonadaceae bacterium]
MLARLRLSSTITRGLVAVGAALVLFAVYAATLAPGVTFWDAGEFIAAAHSLGIPHPPGTPLFILMLNTWARTLAFLPYAVATNLFSAASTAFAGGLSAWWVSRATGSRAAGFAAAIAAGATSSIWQNATETEVYAASLALAVVSIAAADAAGRTGDRRWIALAAYCFALALPLHLSSLVAAPVVIQLASERADGERDWRAAWVLFSMFLCVTGIGRMSLAVVVAGVLLLGASTTFANAAVRDMLREWNPTLAALVVGASGLLFLLLRAQHDPAINQANPSTLDGLVYTIARRQYAVQGILPRQAPFWLQVANWFEYADWQFALSLAPSVIPNAARISATVAFAILAFIGGRWHRARDPRTWRAVMLLFVCGSLGVVVYLNLKAGTSFGWQFVPSDDAHEARDRDYFFVLGFWAWGLWAGIGALRLARRVRLPSIVGCCVAGLPIALNWTAVSRRVMPEAALPRAVAALLLEPLPPRTVLFVSGDNDTYPLWYAQQAEHMRPDVTTVTLPLLGAGWYVDELRRRYGLVGPSPERIAAMARGQGRPVAAAITVEQADREHLAISWTLLGHVLLDPYSLEPSKQHLRVIALDSAAVRLAAARADSVLHGATIRPSTDPVNEYFSAVLSCPRKVLDPAAATVQLASLDSLCNLR